MPLKMINVHPVRSNFASKVKNHNVSKKQCVLNKTSIGPIGTLYTQSKAI